MQRHLILSGAALIVAMGFFAAPQLRGDTVTAEFNPDTTYFTTLNMHLGGVAHGGYAGQISTTRTDTPGVGGAAPASLVPVNFGSYCIELTESFQYSTPYTYSVTPAASAPIIGDLGTTMGSVRAQALAELMDTFFSTSTVDDSTYTAKENSAAFQAAIWEIVDENLVNGALNLNMSSGNFYMDDDPAQNLIRYRAQYFLDQLKLNGYPDTNLVALTNREFQDIVTSAVPLPASAWMGLVGMALIGGYSYLRRARA